MRDVERPIAERVGCFLVALVAVVAVVAVAVECFIFSCQTNFLRRPSSRFGVSSRSKSYRSDLAVKVNNSIGIMAWSMPGVSFDCIGGADSFSSHTEEETRWRWRKGQRQRWGKNVLTSSLSHCLHFVPSLLPVSKKHRTSSLLYFLSLSLNTLLTTLYLLSLAFRTFSLLLKIETANENSLEARNSKQLLGPVPTLLPIWLEQEQTSNASTLTLTRTRTY